jgi:hypothetical protein
MNAFPFAIFPSCTQRTNGGGLPLHGQDADKELFTALQFLWEG